jgi:hypothetical protein
MPKAWEESFEYWLQEGVKQHYNYVWGAYDPTQFTYDVHKQIWAKGLDCSGYIYWAARNAGIPGIRRVTAAEMALGRGGWKGIDVRLGMAGKDRLHYVRPLDIAFWTFKPSRKNGHTGAFGVNPQNGFPGVRHASDSRGGIVYDPIKPWVQSNLTKVRRLTIGDK